MKPAQALRKFWQRGRLPDELALVARGVRHTFFLQGLGLALGYGVHVALARWMGAAEYGIYIYVVAWASLLAVPAGMGLPLLVVRFVSEYRAGEHWALLRGLLRWGGRRVLAVGVALALAGVASVILVGVDVTGDYTRPLLVGLWLAPLQALLNVTGGVYRGFHRIGRAYAIPVFRHLLVLLLALVLWGAGVGLTSVHALVLTLAAAVLVLVAQGGDLWRRVPAPVKQAPPAYATRTWLRVSIPLLLVGGFTLVLNQADVLMAGSILGPREAGLYKAASKTASLASLVLLAAGAAAAPMIASLYAQRALGRLQRLVSVAAHWAFWPSMVLTLFLWFFAQPVLRLFGAEFAEASWVLVVLAGGQLVNAGTGIAGVALSMTGYQGRVAWIIGGSAVLNVLLNGVGLVFFGLIGAALATTLTVALANVSLCLLMIRKMNINPSIIFVLSPRNATGR